MFEVTKEFKFCAAHYLPGHPTCGKVHGHNYRVLVTEAGENLNEEGMVVDFHDMKEVIDPIIALLDHGTLNDHVLIPTAEGIAKFISDEIHKRLTAGPTHVTVFETPTCSARYSQ